MHQSSTQKIKALLQEAMALHQKQQLNEAEALYTQVLKKDPTCHDAWNLLGVLQYTQGHFDKAIQHLMKALALQPKVAAFHYHMALCQIAKKEKSLAESHLKQAIQFDPNYQRAYGALASLHLEQEAYEAAFEWITRLQKVNPEAPEAHEILGLIHEARGQWKESKQAYQETLRLNPRSTVALNNLAALHVKAFRFQEAENHLRQLLNLNPQHADGFNNLGFLYLTQERFKEAIVPLQRALQFNPQHPIAALNLALCFRKTGQYASSIQQYQKILEASSFKIDPNQLDKKIRAKTWAGLCLCCVETANWLSLETFKPLLDQELAAEPKDAEPILTPAEGLLLHLNPILQNRVTEQFAANLRPKRSLVDPPHDSISDFQFKSFSDAKKVSPLTIRDFKKFPHEKIKVGYLSSDLGQHPVGLLAHSVLPHHDRSQFEIFAFSLRPFNDRISEILRAAADHWFDCHDQNDESLVEMIQTHNLDLLIDLSAYTPGSRPALLLHRLAKAQAHWLGFPHSLCLPAVDYYISTEYQTLNTTSHFHERLALLPQSPFTCDLQSDFYQPPSQQANRLDYGLPSDAFVFCCFNQIHRIDPSVFQAWIQILKTTPKSVLWLTDFNSWSTQNLIAEAAQQGLETSRLIFRPVQSLNHDWHQGLADVYLDTWVESGGTTTLFALLAEVPVVCLAGTSAVARTSASLLAAANLNPLIASNPQEYMECAIKLGLDPVFRLQMRKQIALSKQSGVLFNPKPFTRDLEMLYACMLHEI